MKFLFLVQGEGRGHMTQAIVLSQMLTKNGHKITHTFIGKSDRRIVPDYFRHNILSPVEEIISPNFILDASNKSLRMRKTLAHNAMRLGIYSHSLKRIHQKVMETKPDVVINFYDFLGGFYFRFYRPRNVRHICIGRQFLTYHPSYTFAPNRATEKRLFLMNNRLTSQRCDKYIALSFGPCHPQKTGKTVVAPPLLNPEIKKGPVSHEDFLLGYMVNDGYAEEIIQWHRKNKEQKIHCFWDRKSVPETYSPHENLTFHQIDNILFGDMMRRCKGYISTAGFESICEAMYLQKPVLMVPVSNQYEQQCNALEAVKSGAGIMADYFDITSFLEYLKQYTPDARFRRWEEQAENVIIEELTNL